jgi:hypothetical protein
VLLWGGVLGVLLHLGAFNIDVGISERELGLHLFPKLILVVELPNTNKLD